MKSNPNLSERAEVSPLVLTRCTWCLAEEVLTDDHVFPRLIGGTLELSVRACKQCQTLLSAAEKELGRNSIFVFYTIDSGPPGRDKRDAESGAIQAHYALVKDPTHGYNEVQFKAGTEIPITLPSIQIDVASGNARTSGAQPADVDRLVSSLDKLLRGRPDATGFVGEISGRLLDPGDNRIASDPDFWPRIFLDLRGCLWIRARAPEEAERFFQLITVYLQAGAFRDHSSWTTRKIVAGTPHHFRISYDDSSVLRVVAKIAYGIAFLHVGPDRMDSEGFSHVRRYVLTGPASDEPPVKGTALPGTIKDWPDHHVVAVGCHEDRALGIVSLYGACHVVEFGPAELVDIRPAAAICRRKGGETRMLDARSSAELLHTLVSHLKHLGSGAAIPPP